MHHLFLHVIYFSFLEHSCTVTSYNELRSRRSLSQNSGVKSSSQEFIQNATIRVILIFRGTEAAQMLDNEETYGGHSASRC